MKKSKLLVIAVVLGIGFAACESKEKPAEKETVIIEKEVQTESAPVEEDEEGVSIGIERDKDGKVGVELDGKVNKD